MTSTAKLPPRQKKLIVRKPDTNLSAEKRKLSSRSHTDGLNISFVSLRDGSPTDIIHKMSRVDSNESLLLSRSRKLITPSDLNIQKDQQTPSTNGIQTPRHKRHSFNIKQVQNTIQNLSQIKLFNDYTKLNSQKDFLMQQNRRLKKQVADLLKQKQSNISSRNYEQIIRFKKQNRDLEYQCASLGRKVVELQSKIKRKQEQLTDINNLYDSASLEIQHLRSEVENIHKMNHSYHQTMDNLRLKNNKMSEQIRYLNISLTLKARKEVQVKAIEKVNQKLQDLKNKNKKLHKENNALRRNRIIDDDLLQLTPEKGQKTLKH